MNPSDSSTSRPSTSAAPRRPITLYDLLDDLLWPKLLHAPRLALRPQRLLLSLLAVVAMSVFAKLPEVFVDGPGPFRHLTSGMLDASRTILDAARRFHSGDVADAVWALVYTAPRNTLHEYPIWTPLMVVPMLLIFIITGLTLSRMVAGEFCRGITVPWHRALRFGLSKSLSGLFAIATPIIVVAALWGAIALTGLTLGWPILNVFGAILHLIAIGLALVAVLIIAGYLVGWPLLLPTIACEGTDAIDAGQRTLAYVAGRPLRLFLYGLVLLIQAFILTTLIAFVLAGVEALSTAAAGTFVGPEGRQILELAHRPVSQSFRDIAGLGLSDRITIWILQLWRVCLGLGVAAFMLSLHFSSSTLRYLLIRRVCDGQELEEVWMPTLIPGTTLASPDEDPANTGDDQD
ncbi:MAG: hypothetical protein KGS45_05880 [Planctomycetes bacterium]|nr:hypothetical protein [Planctomycetota bacterium]